MDQLLLKHPAVLRTLLDKGYLTGRLQTELDKLFLWDFGFYDHADPVRIAYAFSSARWRVRDRVIRIETQPDPWEGPWIPHLHNFFTRDRQYGRFMVAALMPYSSVLERGGASLLGWVAHGRPTYLFAFSCEGPDSPITVDRLKGVI